jgi:hypothetical protein
MNILLQISIFNKKIRAGTRRLLFSYLEFILQKIINIYDFRFYINNLFCSKSSIVRRQSKIVTPS